MVIAVNKMNIGYLINFDWYPPRGGGTVHAYQVAHQLAKRGHKIHCIYFVHDAPDVISYRGRQALKFLRNIDMLYIRVTDGFNQEVYSLLKLCKFFSLPVVWEINAPLEESLAQGITKRKLFFSNISRRIFAKFVDAGICVSKEVQDYSLKTLKIKNSFLIPNGSDSELFSPAKRNPHVYKDLNHYFKVVWSGSAQFPWQGIELIQEVAQRMLALDKEIIFILITDLNKIDKSLRFPENVKMINTKPYLELPEYIASADIGLCLYHYPIQTGQNKFHLSPLKLFDYMASGLPVIATGLGQIKDIIQHKSNGLLVDNAIDKIIEQIVFLKKNPMEAKRIGTQARKTVLEYYNWERVALETEKVFELITAKQKSEK